MELSWKIMALAIVAVVLCVLLREYQKPLSVLLSLITCVGILLLGAAFFEPIIEVVKRLAGLTGADDEIIAPLFKVVGIGLLTHISSGICQDAAENTLGKTVEFCGTILALYAALPLLRAVLELVESMMGGLK